MQHRDTPHALLRNASRLDERYDIENDKHEIDNLAFDPASREKLLEMRSALADWQQALKNQPNKYIVRVANRAINELLDTNHSVP